MDKKTKWNNRLDNGVAPGPINKTSTMRYNLCNDVFLEEYLIFTDKNESDNMHLEVEVAIGK